MAENLKAFREAMQRQERQTVGGDTHRRSEDKPIRPMQSVVEAGNAQYQGYITTINGMRDRDIERAMTGR